MRRSILILALCSLFFVPTFAQEAFYIYRNDGDFNGFFYDEVVEMRYSKIDLDSVEHENYIMYEVQLADTLYRIPLAAIDSISFIQPEMRLNPRVKFIEKEGYCPYLSKQWGRLKFIDLPEEMTPQVGDILIGLPSDACSSEYGWDGGSFSCVVESVTRDGNILYVNGGYVTEISQVFDQYITVEQIGIDENNQVRRRIAGCDSNGWPRRMKQAEGNEEITLVNVDGKIEKEFDTDKGLKINLNAQVAVKLKMRAAYNITWRRFYVKVSKDLQVRIKPSLDIGFTGIIFQPMDDWIKLPSILFPANCPVFETKPTPVPFIRLQGNIQAELNMPEVYLGFGDDIIFDSNHLFPISYDIHLVPDEHTEPTQDMLSGSAGFKFSGSAQAGILLRANLATASWFERIVQGQVGINLYCGPKVEGVVFAQVSFGDMTTHYAGSEVATSYDPYINLKQSYVGISLLAIDLEAVGYASSFATEPTENTFYSKGWAFMTDTTRFVYEFDSIKVDTTGGKTKLILKPITNLHTYDQCYIGLYNVSSGLYQVDPVVRLGGWQPFPEIEHGPVEYTYTISDEEAYQLGYKTYWAAPMSQCGNVGVFAAEEAKTAFHIPLKIEMSDKILEFGAKDGSTDSIQFKTNYVDTITGGSANGFCYTPIVTKISEEEHTFNAQFKIRANQTLFERVVDKTDGIHAPNICLGYGSYRDQRFYFSYRQAANSLSDVSVNYSGYFSPTVSSSSASTSADYNGPITATRIGTDAVQFSGSSTIHTTEIGHSVTYERTIQFIVTKVDESTIKCNGGTVWYKRTEEADLWTETKEVTHIIGECTGTVNQNYNSNNTYNVSDLSGNIIGGTFDFSLIYKREMDKNMNRTEHSDFDSFGTSPARIKITVNSLE